MIQTLKLRVLFCFIFVANSFFFKTEQIWNLVPPTELEALELYSHFFLGLRSGHLNCEVSLYVN